jgi:hypothetical protein
MPKETVYCETVESIGETVTPVVEVRWSREAGDVQIVTRELNAEIPAPDERDKETGMPPAQYGYYGSLDRKGINDLIRHLRRARDQAFGRDE